MVWNDTQSGSFVALPLIVNDEPAGVLLLYARVRDFFDEEEMRLLHELAGDISFALHHLEQKAQMDYLAYHDSLTDLPNRSLFTDRMTQALNAARREKRFAAAVFLDVERFRMVNETFGRKAGDDLLRTIATRLRGAAREQDTVARTGADHFAIAEALFRWTDPELGSVPPSKFVGLLEETGMILAAGRWALHQAAADIRHWQSLGVAVPRIAVNVSAIQLRQPDFVDTVLEAISALGDMQPLLDLEITESVLVDDIEGSTRKLQTLRRAGVEVSVDDFGTGYCSLSYLARLPVDMLKIDRSFVVRMRDAGYPRNIVAMIVSLAHTLGLKVIAEGVEEDEQVHLLKELGCDQIQGYYVSMPVPAEQIELLLRPEADLGLRRRIAAEPRGGVADADLARGNFVGGATRLQLPGGSGPFVGLAVTPADFAEGMARLKRAGVNFSEARFEPAPRGVPRVTPR